MLSLADLFYSAGLISDDVYSSVTSSGTKDELEKAEVLLQAVIDSVMLSKEYYHKMMDILKEKREYKFIVEILNNEYKKQGKFGIIYKHDG